MRTNRNIQRALTITRRVLFIATLVFLSSVTIGIFHYAQHLQQATRFSASGAPSVETKSFQSMLTDWLIGGPGMPLVGVLAWGADSIGWVLAVWLVTRTGVWGSWRGRLRATLYIVAYAYGQMLFDTTQNYWTKPNASFRLPGGLYDDYARPMLDLPSLLIDALLLAPVAAIVSAVLTTLAEPLPRGHRFSIAGLIGLTTATALLLTHIRFLTTDWAPRTAFRGMEAVEAVTDFLAPSIAYSIPVMLAVAIVFYGLTKRWSAILISFPLAIVVQAIGYQSVVNITEYATGQAFTNVLTDSRDRWLITAGQVFTLTTALATARALGVRPVIASTKVAISREPSSG